MFERSWINYLFTIIINQNISHLEKKVDKFSIYNNNLLKYILSKGKIDKFLIYKYN